MKLIKMALLCFLFVELTLNRIEAQAFELSQSKKVEFGFSSIVFENFVGRKIESIFTSLSQDNFLEEKCFESTGKPICIKEFKIEKIHFEKIKPVCEEWNCRLRIVVNQVEVGGVWVALQKDETVKNKWTENDLGLKIKIPVRFEYFFEMALLRLNKDDNSMFLQSLDWNVIPQESRVEFVVSEPEIQMTELNEKLFSEKEKLYYQAEFKFLYDSLKKYLSLDLLKLEIKNILGKNLKIAFQDSLKNKSYWIGFQFTSGKTFQYKDLSARELSSLKSFSPSTDPYVYNEIEYLLNLNQELKREISNLKDSSFHRRSQYLKNEIFRAYLLEKSSGDFQVDLPLDFLKDWLSGKAENNDLKYCLGDLKNANCFGGSQVIFDHSSNLVCDGGKVILQGLPLVDGFRKKINYEIDFLPCKANLCLSFKDLDSGRVHFSEVLAINPVLNGLFRSLSSDDSYAFELKKMLLSNKDCRMNMIWELK